MAKPTGTSGRFTLRHLLRAAIWFLVIILLCFGISNLWLSSRWGKDIAESKLKEKTGLEWQVAAMTWSPWNGITVRDAKMLQPKVLQKNLTENVISVKLIQVKPYWRELLHGRIRPRDVIVESPKLALAVEMLATLASNVASNDLQKKTVRPKVVKKQKPTDTKKSQPPTTAKPAVTLRPTKTPTQPAKTERPAAGLPLHLHIRNASLRVVSVSKKIDLMQWDEVSLDMPLLGEDAEGIVRVKKINLLGFPDIVDVKQAIVWRRPFLEIEEKTINLAGLKIRFRGLLDSGRVSRGELPFLLDLTLMPQKLDDVKMLDWLALRVAARQVSGKLRMNGFLNKPLTWRADMILEGEHLVVKEQHDFQDVCFDEIRVPAIFRQGQLYWAGVRLIGEDISILGNGRVSARDGILSVTRLVVSPEVAVMITRAINGARIVGTNMSWWEDLDTPDRKYRDIIVSGSLHDPVIDAGRNHANIPARRVVSSTLKFIREEMKEDGVEIAPLPNSHLRKEKNSESY